jgi:hypothetical protein
MRTAWEYYAHHKEWDYYDDCASQRMVRQIAICLKGKVRQFSSSLPRTVQ